MSANATLNFLRQIRSLRPTLFPHLRLAGIVGNRTYHSEPGKFTDREQNSIARIREMASSVYGHGDHFMDRCNIADRADIAVAAGRKLAYFEKTESRAMFLALAEEIQRRTIR